MQQHEQYKQLGRHLGRNMVTLGGWVLMSLLIGVAAALLGTAFSLALAKVTSWNEQVYALRFCLPLLGLLILGGYRLAKLDPESGMRVLVHTLRHEEKFSWKNPVLMAGATLMSHLGGASVGRESAAVQLGGGTAGWLAQKLGFNASKCRIAAMCGMSAVFAVLFGTPLAGCFYVLETVDGFHSRYRRLMPCVLSSIVAVSVSRLLGAPEESFLIAQSVEFSWISVLKILPLAVVCGLGALLYVRGMKLISMGLKKWLPNSWARIALGGSVFMLITLLPGMELYTGAGMEGVQAALAGYIPPYAFAVKLLLTGLCLGCGFKGGKIVPAFFVGAALGCTVGPLVGLPASFAAAMGMVAVYCGCAGCPISALLLGVELFGDAHLWAFAMMCTAAYLLTRRMRSPDASPSDAS